MIGGEVEVGGLGGLGGMKEIIEKLEGCIKITEISQNGGCIPVNTV